MSRVVGVDVGGTFTDVVVLDGESMDGHKVRTTADQSDGVARALSDAGIDEGTTILHGTTAGTNALIEGRGARTALVTSPGFEDLLEIGRQARPSLYDPFVDRPDALCPRDLRFGYTGDVEAIGGMVDAGARRRLPSHSYGRTWTRRRSWIWQIDFPAGSAPRSRWPP